jgi:hypothetical protein
MRFNQWKQPYLNRHKKALAAFVSTATSSNSLIFCWRLFMPGMNACPSGEDWDSKGKGVLVQPQGAQRPRLGPLPARGAKPHSFRLTNYRPMSATMASQSWKNAHAGAPA